MAPERRVMPGMVNNGMVVPPTDTPLPEGVHVDMHMGLAEVPAELTSACAQWDKASDEVSSWFGDEDAERRRQQDQHRGRGPKNYARSDERIQEEVNDRLTDDGSLDASDIDVSVSGREVTLSGEVSSRMDKRRAEDIAESISGVTHVQNNLRVKQNNQFGSTSSGAGSLTGRTGAQSSASGMGSDSSLTGRAGSDSTATGASASTSSRKR